MKRLRSKRWLALVAGLVLLLLAVSTAGASHYRVWSWRDLRAYRAMGRECHPAWRELDSGRVAAGQDVEAVISATKPVWVERYGEFVRLHYQEGLSFTGVTVVAKSGRLAGAAAWSCTWDRMFFDELTPDDHQAFRDAYKAHWQPIRKRQAEAAPADAPEPPAE